MVDMESHYHPPSPLEDSVLDSPLCADDDFMGGMEELQDISQSISDDALSSFDVPEYQSSSNGSEGSTVLGKGKESCEVCFHIHMCVLMHFSAHLS